MAFSFGNLTNSTTFVAGAGNRTIAFAGTATINTQIIGVVFAVATTGTFGLSDDHPDGLGTYTKILDVLDNSGVSQMSIFARDHLIGSAGATPNWTTSGISGGTAVGIAGAFVSGVSSAFVGASCIRQSGGAPNVAANVAPVVNLSRGVLSSSALLAWTMRDDTTTATNGPSGFGNFIGTSNAAPAVAQRAHTLVSGGLGNSFLWTTTPGVTSCAVILEFNNFGPPSVSVSAPAYTSLFPKPVLRGVV